MCEIEWNDETVTPLIDEDRYPDGANSPTRHAEYPCPCGKGRVVFEHVLGFGDTCAFIKCRRCNKKYDTVLGCGHLWELEERE